MGLPNEVNSALIGAAAAGGYEIEQSLRFLVGTGNNLSFSPSSASGGLKLTMSCWYKGSGPETQNGYLLWSGGRANINGAFGIGWTNGSKVHYFNYRGSSYQKAVDRALRDPSAWYHIIVAIDRTQSDSANRERFWINGVEQTNFDPNQVVGQNNGILFGNVGNPIVIGHGRNSAGSLNGDLTDYLAEYHAIDGTQITDPTTFGEYNDDGVWVPKKVSGVTYGTNGFYLKFDPSATNGIGHDHSGNGNNFTASGFTTSGTDTDVMSDTPTNNFATWNPLAAPYSGTPTYSEGNLHFSLSDGPSTISTIGVSSGKWYCEIKSEGTMSHRPIIGLNHINPTSQGEPGDRVWPGWDVAYAYNGNRWVNYSTSSYGSSWSSGDIIGIALDLDSATQTVTFYLNGTSQGSINIPTANKTWFVSASSYGTDGDNLQFTANFGQRDFEYTQPSGYNSWCTANLPAPDIADPATAFDLVTYEGTGTTNTLTVDFSPNFAWIKRYDGTGNNILVDTLRGATPPTRLISDSTASEYANSDGVNSFSSTGVVLDGTGGGGGDVNQTTRNYWAAQWDGNGTGTSNTDGSITSTVSANATAGFSIVSYSGGSTGSTVGHGLGVAPEMIIVKNRDSATDWMVWLDGFTSSQGLNLNNADGRFTSGSNTFIYDVTSTTFKIGSSSIVNAGGEDFIAYCFTEIEGFSKIGNYEGNGSSTDGPFVYLGFKPKFIIFKGIDSGSRQWNIMNSLRIPYNGTYARTVAESNLGESDMADSAAAIDILSNGFKVLANSSATNASGETYIFYAVAENPFGGSGVSPATAR